MQCCLQVSLAQDRRQVLLDVVGLAFLDQQDGALAGAKARHLARHDRVRDVHHVQRNARIAVDVGETQPLEGANQRVVHAALDDDADVVDVLGEELVQAALLDEADRRRPALVDLFLLVRVGRRRQNDPVGGAPRRRQRIARRERRAPVGAGGEAAVDVAGADAQQQHHRRVARFRELEAGLHRRHHRRQVRPRVEQPDLRLHCERVAALLHDRRAFAIVFADDDERAAGDAARREVGEASDATLMPTGPLNVTAPRSG